MHNYKIPAFTDCAQMVSYDTYEDALKIVANVVNTYSDDLNKGWLTSASATKKKYDIENRTKFFLDCLGYLLLQASHNANRNSGVTSLYKERARRDRELPHDFQDDSFIPEIPEERLISVRPVRIRKDRPYEIPDLKTVDVTYCTVDTDNVFYYDGMYYVIDQAVDEYAPKHVGSDLLYDMTRVIVTKSRQSGELEFFDEHWKPISRELVSAFEH